MNLVKILDWSEFWALLIPIAVLIFRRRLPVLVKPVLAFIFIALILNLIQIIIVKYEIKLWFTSDGGDNLFVYNTFSICRFFCFNWFFRKLLSHKFSFLKKILPAIVILFIIFYYSFFESYVKFGSLAMGIEAAGLLVYCLSYYYWIYEEESEFRVTATGEFYIVTGLSIYVVVNFPLFIWYGRLTQNDGELAAILWNIHNVTYILFCIFIATGLYRSAGSSQKQVMVAKHSS